MGYDPLKNISYNIEKSNERCNDIYQEKPGIDQG